MTFARRQRPIPPGDAVSVGWSTSAGPGRIVIRDAKNLSERVLAVPFTQENVRKHFPRAARFINWTTKTFLFPVCLAWKDSRELVPIIWHLGVETAWLGHALLESGFTGNAFYRVDGGGEWLTWTETVQAAQACLIEEVVSEASDWVPAVPHNYRPARAKDCHYTAPRGDSDVFAAVEIAGLQAHVRRSDPSVACLPAWARSRLRPLVTSGSAHNAVRP